MTGCYLSDSWKLNRTSVYEIASQNIDVDVSANQQHVGYHVHRQAYIIILIKSFAL